MKYIIVFCLIAAIFSCGDSTYSQGQSLYKSKCANCHMEDGTGLAGLIPPLANTDFLLENKDQIACYIRKGLKDPVLVNGDLYTQQVMPAIPSLTDVEITNITNYILTAWGNKGEIMTLDEVKKHLDKCQ
ncbi:MAG: c-type cytochrome [Saprospiraceae bacterium]